MKSKTTFKVCIRAPGQLDQEIVDYILTKAEKKTPIPPEDLPYVYEKNYKIMEDMLGREPKEEEVVAYSIFPEPVRDYFEEKKAQATSVESSASVSASSEPISFRMIPPSQ